MATTTKTNKNKTNHSTSTNVKNTSVNAKKVVPLNSLEERRKAREKRRAIEKKEDTSNIKKVQFGANAKNSANKASINKTSNLKEQNDALRRTKSKRRISSDEQKSKIRAARARSLNSNAKKESRVVLLRNVFNAPARRIDENGVVTDKIKLFKSGHGIDIPFLITVLALLCLGLIMLFSASYAYSFYRYDNSFTLIGRQILFAVVGFVGLIFMSYIDYHFLRRFCFPAIGVSVVLLGIVFMLPSDGGVSRWIELGFFSIQPTEIAKFTLILIFAAIYSKQQELINRLFPELFVSLFIPSIFIILTVLEPHYSAAIIMALITLIMMFVGGVKIRIFVFLGLVAITAALLVFWVKGGYIVDRITIWQDPFDTSNATTWQTRNSLYAIGSGGFMGMGLGQSRQKYQWLPESQNDFIFSIIVEELGLCGALIILALFGLLVYRGIVIALRCPDKFGMLLAFGFSVSTGLHALINVCVVTNIFPNTGISLPFFSYGGSSLIMILVEMGVVLSVSRSYDQTHAIFLKRKQLAEK